MESINRPELVKEHNLNLVREKLFEARQATRQQLSAMTGISTVTLGNLLQQLVTNGEALETDTLQPASGRPARVYSYNDRRLLGLLVSVIFTEGRDQFQASLVNLYGEVVWEDRSPAACLDPQGTQRYFDRLLHLRGPVGAIAIGLPGIGFRGYLRRENKPYFPLDVLRELEQFTGIPVRLENDVNLAALGYARRHNVGTEETLVYLYLMKGSFGGSAIYLGGKLHLGKDRFAGEFLPAPYGGGWDTMSAAPEDVLLERLLSVTLPYLTILAPHRLVVASDYIRQEHLQALEARARPLLNGHIPSFYLAKHFPEDYREGMKQTVLEEFKWKRNAQAWT